MQLWPQKQSTCKELGGYFSYSQFRLLFPTQMEKATPLLLLALIIIFKEVLPLGLGVGESAQNCFVT
jgi:hypothetical protein